MRKLKIAYVIINVAHTVSLSESPELQMTGIRCCKGLPGSQMHREEKSLLTSRTSAPSPFCHEPGWHSKAALCQTQALVGWHWEMGLAQGETCISSSMGSGEPSSAFEAELSGWSCLPGKLHFVFCPQCGQGLGGMEVCL